MNLNTVYNACMSKMASMEMGGMYKSAAPNDGSQSAQIGRSNSYNEYAARLEHNADIHYNEVNPPPTDPKQSHITPQYVNLRRVTKYGPDRFSNSRVGSTGRAITQNELDAYRKRVAEDQAHGIFSPDTNQFDAAKQYLIERGKENQQRYKDGTLWKNEPSKVPMPKVISAPMDVQALEHAGYYMANNNQPRNPNIGYA